MHILAVDEHAGRWWHGGLDGGGGIGSCDAVDFLDAVAVGTGEVDVGEEEEVAFAVEEGFGVADWDNYGR